jgi:hypothetical protein
LHQYTRRATTKKKRHNEEEEMELVYARSAKQPGLLKHRDKRLLIAVVVSIVTGAGLGEIFWPRVKPSFEEAVEPVQESNHKLPNEAAFEQTLRSCLGSACYTATPKGSKAEARIALLAPPSEAADAFFAWYVALAKRGGATARKVEWIQTAHAPPYGYGKNHGYTRIVRLALPLLSSVAASSQGNAAESLAQHVRWHCRVSHVAAHTAQLTVRSASDLADVVERRLTTERLLSFAGLKVAPDLLDEGERTFAPVLRALQAADASIDALDASRWRLADVLSSELSATQNLRAWPCRSLWVDMDDAALVEAAKALSPNCSRPFTTCSVGRDREEMFGKRSEPIK